MSAPHFEFHTPTRSERDPQVIHLDLCGEPHELQRPKDWTLNRFTSLTDNSVPLSEQAAAMIALITGTFGYDGWERIITRATNNNDPLNWSTLVDAMQQLYNTWSDWDAMPPRPSITATPQPGGQLGEPVTFSYPDLGITREYAYPPKDILLAFVHAIAARADGGGEQWIVRTFLSAIVEPHVYTHIVYQLDDPTPGTPDVEHIDPLLSQLIEHWTSQVDTLAPAEPAPANRAERRAAGGAHAAPSHLSGTLTQ